eukprot:1548202-Amphidinium_carterae.2
MAYVLPHECLGMALCAIPYTLWKASSDMQEAGHNGKIMQGHFLLNGHLLAHRGTPELALDAPELEAVVPRTLDLPGDAWPAQLWQT